MVDPVTELKTRAELLLRALHARLQKGGASHWSSMCRMRALTQWAKAEDGQLQLALPDIRRKHCLAVVARESGFSSWAHACRVLHGDAQEDDYGTLLYGRRAGGALNCWSASYTEAKALLDVARAGASGVRRYLLAYRRQFFLCEGAFIASLGMDPDNADWQAIGWDWVVPADRAARRRLCAMRLVALREEL